MKNQGLNVPELFMSANWFSEKEMEKLFEAGIKVGVRGFDTAREYKVEKQVGRALRNILDRKRISREEIFVQTRIGNEELVRCKSAGNIKAEVYASLERMKLDYLDCFMFHWPTPDYYIDAWHQLEELYTSEKVIHSIGICNCRMRHLLQMEKECRVMPHILQVEITPFWQAKDIQAYCKKKGIVLQAFSPLCKMIPPIKENNVLKDIARKYGVSVPQVILRWDSQLGIRPISLSGKVERVLSNFDISCFELSDEDMAQIASLDCGYKYHLESATCSGF